MHFEIKTKNFAVSLGKAPAEESRTPNNVDIKVKDYTYAPLRTALLPTPAQLKQAVMTVDGDPRPMYDILRRLPIADIHLASVMVKRQDAIKGYEWKVKPASINADNEVEKKRCEEIENRLEKSNFKDCLKALDNGIIYGHSVVVPHWVLNNKNEYYAHFEPIDFVHFAKQDKKLKLIYDKTFYDFFLTIGQDTTATSTHNLVENSNAESIARRVGNSDRLRFVDLPESGLIIMQNNPFEGLMNNYVGGIIRPALYLTVLKYFDILDWAKFNELHGMPLRVGKFDPLLSSDNAISTLKTAIQNLGVDASAVIDNSTQIEFIESKSSNSGQKNTYQMFIDHVENKQSILLLGNNLTTQISGQQGSRAAATVHETQGMDKTWSDIEDVEPKITAEVIEKDYFYNYGAPPNGAFPEFEFVTEENKDISTMAGAVRDLTASGLDISKEWAYDYFDIKGPKDEKDKFGGGSSNPFNLGG